MKYIAFVFILAIGTVLRVASISWGVPTTQFAHPPFHPDEVWAMSVLAQADIDKGDFNPEEAHREGTLAYFIWTSGAYVLNKIGIIPHLPINLNTYDESYAKVLLSGRYIVVFFDLLTGILIFVTVSGCANNFYAALLAMLVFYIIPFEVIHAHYLRTHIVANFFIALVCFTAFKIYSSQSKKLYLFAGLVGGLGIATRYPTLSALAIPGCVFIFNAAISRENLIDGFTRLTKCFIEIRHWVYLFGILIGVLIGVPFLFIDFESARPHLLQQASYVAQEEFSITSLLKLDKVWIYINYLIPYGTLPFLWILLYGSVIYLCFCKKYYRYFVPILAFMVIYLYSMAKGYLATPIFIRAALPLFPVLAICVGFCAAHAIESLKSLHRSFYYIFGGVVSFIILSTIAYDFAYLHAMQSDARARASQYIQNNWKKNIIRIGVYSHPHNYIVVNPAFNAIPNLQVFYTEKQSFKEDKSDIDLLVLSSFEYTDHAIMKNRAEWLKNSNQFVHVKSFRTPLHFGGINFNYKRNPHDLSYPLVELDLWRPLH
jgi:hypothetical protein